MIDEENKDGSLSSPPSESPIGGPFDLERRKRNNEWSMAMEKTRNAFKSTMLKINGLKGKNPEDPEKKE
jgi:hypothetical protein